jgi:CCR4-NOT transcription complex subunit 9
MAGSSSGLAPGQAAKDKKMASAEQLVLELCDPELRENALLELSKVASTAVVAPVRAG